MKIEILRHDVINNDIQQQVKDLFNELNSNIKQLSLTETLKNNNNIVLAVCKEDNTLIAMAAMVTYKVISGHKGMIEDVIVSGNQRGKGLGRKLMEKLLDEAKNMELNEIILFSGHHRTAAISLYKSLGFQLKDSGLYRLIFD
ncbi:GNAT family N-acetyltransferase [Aurantibacter crassamenti]|uniref:GNAT family N-acetyltransferase n=1 Tax=Aurantibacter crassamenti TaxID=1837375 RepID=UPI00193A7836|nr:GNAT family N-acetyltransferase [Aurantibacter crassamenti]MBM1107242.1 GNAT family N-acetyltransferase [Aurantibacter crassamenti]